MSLDERDKQWLEEQREKGRQWFRGELEHVRADIERVETNLLTAFQQVGLPGGGSHARPKRHSPRLRT